MRQAESARVAANSADQNPLNLFPGLS
jgi:hypothetical protein